MNEQSRAFGEQWLDAQQAMWKTFLSGGPADKDGTQRAPEATPLVEQFNELREMFAPAAWPHGAGAGPGVLDAVLQRVLEGPRYAVLFDLDRQLLELQKL